MVIKKIVFIILYIFMVCLAFAQENDSTADTLGADEKEKKGLSVNVSYGHGWVFDTEYIDLLVSPLSFGAHISYLSQKKSAGNIGVELSFSWLQIITEKSTDPLITNIVPIAVNFVYQYRFSDTVLLDSHLGVGVSFHHLSYRNTGASLLTLGLLCNMGLGFQVDVTPDMYAKASIQYALMLPQEIMTHILMPSVAIGYKF